MAYNKFNLLPKETFEKRKEKRIKVDKISILSALLPFLGVLTWLVMIFLNYNTEGQILQVEADIQGADREISSFELIRNRHSILVLKTQALGDTVALDVNPESFFNIVQQTIDDSGLDIKIESYGRDTTGLFSFSATADNYDTVAKITRLFRNLEEIREIELVEANKNEDDRVSFTIRFEIIYDFVV